MEHCGGDKNRTWHQFTSVLAELTSLEQMHFGQCPAPIIHSVADKLANLHVLTAESITDTIVDTQAWSVLQVVYIPLMCVLPTF